MNRLLIEKENDGWHVRRDIEDSLSYGEVMAFIGCLVTELHDAWKSAAAVYGPEVE